MLREKISYLCCLLFLGVAFTSCTDSYSGEDIFPQEKFALTAFAVKVDDTYYHGKIDQNTHRVEIGAIEDASIITGVYYELENDSAKITPDPATFVGNWKKEQTVTVTTEDKKETQYVICLTKFKDPSGPDTDLKIVFEDNFDTDGNPDADKWVLCKKGGSNWCDEMSESYDQAFVKDGNLVLQAIKDAAGYKAGGIESKGKFGFAYGKVEARAKITKHPTGAFPAVWLNPNKFIYSGWPNCGEMDIMEHVKQDAFIYHTIHTKYANSGQGPAKSTTVKCNVDEYNVYGLEWTPDELKFFVNGVQTFTYPNLHLDNEAEAQQWPFTGDSEFYIILNMGLGGSDGWVGSIDDANLPAEMLVDWVRVYANEHTIVK